MLGPLARSLARRSLPEVRSPLQTRTFAAVGDKFPAVNVHQGFPPATVDLGQHLAGKKVIVVGLPGAFTPV